MIKAPWYAPGILLIVFISGYLTLSFFFDWPWDSGKWDAKEFRAAVEVSDNKYYLSRAKDSCTEAGGEWLLVCDSCVETQRELTEEEIPLKTKGENKQLTP